jgi:hypothetical protein
MAEAVQTRLDAAKVGQQGLAPSETKASIVFTDLV